MKSLCGACLLVLICARCAAASSFDSFNHGIAAWNRRDSGAAISFLSEALTAGDLAPELKPVALVDRGWAYLWQDKYTEAIADFDTAMKLRPQFYEAMSGHASALAAGGHKAAALAECEPMLKLWPYNPIVHERCGRLDWESGNYSEAKSRFESALAFDPHNRYTFLWLCLAVMESHSESQNPLRTFARDLDLDSWPSPIVDLYLGNGSLERAERAEGDGDDPTRRDHACEVGFYGGEWQLLQGRPDAGRALLKQAAEICPGNFIEAEPAKSELERLSNGAPQ